jgi:imidazolonepropionase-like amidohydrolase
MQRHGGRCRCGSSVAALFGLLIVTVLPSERAVSQDLRIEHVTVISPESPRELRDANVTVRGGRIAAVVPAAKDAPARQVGVPALDGRGLYLIPGLIDSHVHLGAIPGMTDEQERAHPEIARAARAQIPRSYLDFGFTTLIDLVSTPAEMARWKSHDPVPDTYFCGGAALIDGYPMNYLPKPQRYARMPYLIVEPQGGGPLPPGVDPAAHSPQAVIARMKSDGAICVKTFFERGFGGVHDLPVPKPETIRSLVQAAHAAGLPVLLHANSAEAQTFGLDTGVDILAHGLWNADETAAPGELTPAVKAILDRIVMARVGWQPTLQVLHGLEDLFNPGFLSDPLLARVLPRSLIDWYGTPEGQAFRAVIAADLPAADPGGALRRGLAVPIGRAAAATGYLAKHGARLLFGTDTPSGPIYTNPPGLNAWMEMQRLIDAGVTPAQIFEAATLNNARALQRDREIGTVEVGKRANLLLVRADPRQTVQAYAEIVKVILGGRVLDPATLAAKR